MICFLDRTFFSSSSECANKSCPSNLTPELIERGTKWWGNENFPVAMSDYADGCKDFKQHIER